jgi:hypothetical protein
VKLGGYRGGPVPDAQLGGKAVAEAANAFAGRVGPMMRAMKDQGMSLRQIAAAMVPRGIHTARGGEWTATAVKNVLARA